MKKPIEKAAARHCYGTPYRYLIRLHVYAFAGELTKKATDELLVLDVGCGKSTYPYAFKEFRIRGRYLGGDVEIFRSSWKKMKKDLVKEFSADYVCFDATHLPLREQSFDAVMCIATLEHIKSDRVVVEEISKALKEGGVAYFWVPSKNSWLFDFGKHGHHFYSAKDITELFRNTNLALRRVEPTGGVLCFLLTCSINWLKLIISAVAFALRRGKRMRKYLAEGVDRWIARRGGVYDPILKYCVRKDYAGGNTLPGGYSIVAYKPASHHSNKFEKSTH